MQTLIEPAFWGLQFLLVTALLLGAYRLRPRLGLSAVVAVVVSLQFFQAVLSASFYWEFGDGLLATPGSAVLFASNLALLLYAFSRDGIATARIILYAIIIGNVVTHLFGGLLYAHITYSEPVNFVGIPDTIFYQGLMTALVGVAVLYLDQVLALLGFSWLRRRFPSLPVAVPMSLVLVVILALDTVLFLTITQWGHELLGTMLISGVVAKSVGGLAFGVVWGVYLQHRRLTKTDDVQQVLRFIFFQDDIEKLREAASRDALTGLYNRRTFDRLGEQLFDREENKFSLILCDVDHFKQVNDTLGHTAGDRILEEIADYIAESVREMDFTFRLGGDEFAVMLPRCDAERATEVAERLSEFRFEHEELGRPVTLTMGLSTFPDDAADLDGLYEVADERLYVGKEGGRDGFEAG